jgi:hypothetical protein
VRAAAAYPTPRQEGIVIQTSTTTRQAARDTLPVALSVAPFGLVIGATATQLGLSPLADMAASVRWSLLPPCSPAPRTSRR